MIKKEKKGLKEFSNKKDIIQNVFKTKNHIIFMAKDQIYSSKMKYLGIFNFKDYYNFCYQWLTEETGLKVEEEEYSEKLKGATKNIDIKWKGSVKVSDYFAFEIKVEFKILAMSEVEINKEGIKLKTNNGEISTKVKSTLVKDYDGKFESSGRMKIWRGIYEKWIISQRIKYFEDKLTDMSDAFLGQAKAFLDLEGQR